MPNNEHPAAIRFWYTRTGAFGQKETDAKLTLLPERQQQQFHSLRTSKRRQQYLCSRLLMCHALSEHFMQPTSYWHIEERPQAKPVIHNLPIPGHISLSHSHDLVCFAFSPLKVGIDAELMKAGRDFHEMSKLFMNDEELRQIPKTSDEQQLYFYRLWCAKEAFYKALPAANQHQTTLATISYRALSERNTGWQLIESQLEDFRIAIVSEGGTPSSQVIKTRMNL